MAAARHHPSPIAHEDRDEPAGSPTRERILAEAARLFHNQGYHATTMREIASGVGIKAGSLYNHFASKQELLYRISYDTMRDMLSAALDAMAGHREPRERLRAFVRAHTEYCIRERHRARVADELRDLEPHYLRDVIAIRDQYELLLRGILEEVDAVVGGVVDVPITVNAIATMGSAVMTWYRDHGRLSPDEIADIYAELAVRAATGSEGVRRSR